MSVWYRRARICVWGVLRCAELAVHIALVYDVPQDKAAADVRAHEEYLRKKAVEDE